jgi:hypothetical protein
MISSKPQTDIKLDTYEDVIFAMAAIAESKSGCKLYACGGWVRDKLLDKPSSDIDFIIHGGDASLFYSTFDSNFSSTAKNLLAKGIVLEKVVNSSQLNSGVLEGSALKQYFIKFLEQDSKTELASIDLDFRVAEFKSLLEDLKSRDFTVNGLLYSLEDREVVDHCGVDTAQLGPARPQRQDHQMHQQLPLHFRRRPLEVPARHPVLRVERLHSRGEAGRAHQDSRKARPGDREEGQAVERVQRDQQDSLLRPALRQVPRRLAEHGPAAGARADVEARP